MDRKELLQFAEDLISEYLQQIAEMCDIEYTWQEMLADYTGVVIKTLEELEDSPDEVLRQIREAYI